MSQAPRPSGHRRTSLPVARVGAALSVLAWLLHGTSAPKAAAPPSPEASAPPMWATDSSPEATPPPAGGRKAGGEVLRGQKPARGGSCGHPDQVAIGGGCWVEVAKRPVPPAGCGDFYEFQGRCYIPVQQAPKVPTSINP